MKRSFTIIGFLAILALFMTNTNYAQNEKFRVLASKGETLLQQNCKGDWSKISTGSVVNTSDKIKLSKGSYLALIHSNGKTLELSKLGVYSAQDLCKTAKSKKTSVSGRLANYVLEEINSSDNIFASDDYKKKMATTGSVNRSFNNLEAEIAKGLNEEGLLQTSSPRKFNTIYNNILLSWIGNKDKTKYVFTITDRFNKVIFKKELYNCFISIDSKKLKLEPDTYYFWNVYIKNNPILISSNSCFLIQSTETSKDINSKLQDLKNEIGNENTPMNKIILAAFFEENNLINDALLAYREAVKLAPNIDEYKKIYNKFLERNSIATN